MPPRSFAALLVLVALVAAPAAGLGVTTQAGAPAGGGPDAAVGGSGSPGSVALAQQATTTAGPPTGTAGTPDGTGTPSGSVTGTPDPAPTATPTPADRGTLPPSEETWRLQLEPDGDARWRVSVTIPIRNAEDATAFDDVAADFGAVENPLGYEFFRRAAAEAGAETGREMAIEDVSRSTSRVNGTGTLNVSFTWTNFARTDGDRLVVGDGFNTTRGSWLPSLGDRMTLVVVPPSGYGVTSAPEVGIVDGAARWEGPYDFAGREPWIVYSGSAPTPTPRPVGPNVTASPGTGTQGTDTPGGGPFGSLLPVAALAVVAGASAAVLVVYMRREDGGSGAIGSHSGNGGDGGATAGPAGQTDAAADSENGSGATPAGGDPTGPHGEATVGGADGTASGDGSAGGAAGVGAAATGAGADDGDAEDGDDEDEADDGIDEELLSDEERVERLLERNGGRMKQATIVKETGWSNAKVSQLLSAMAEDDRVDKLRIGRENLISFPDEDVTDIDSSSE